MQCGVCYLAYLIYAVSTVVPHQVVKKKTTFKAINARVCDPVAQPAVNLGVKTHLFWSPVDHLSPLQVWLDACLPRNYRPISHHFLIASHTATPTQWSHKSASRGSVGSSTLDMKLAASLPSDSQKLSSGNASDALIKRFRSLHIASEWKLQPNCRPNLFIPTRVITDECPQSKVWLELPTLPYTQFLASCRGFFFFYS